jgi:hypothetical protein
MLLMCLPLVIYSASMQILLERLSHASTREADAGGDEDR